MMILPVSDARRPVAFKSIKLNSDNNNYIAEGSQATIPFYNVHDYDNDNEVIYLDQYGKELKSSTNTEIIKSYFNKTINGKKYGIKVKADKNYAKLCGTLGTDGKIFRNTDSDSITLAANLNSVDDTTSAVSTTFKFSIVTTDSSNNDSTVSAWDNVDNEKSIAYTVVPLHKLTGLAISKIGKQEISTSNSNQPNLAEADVTLSDAVTGTLDVVSAPLLPHNADKADTLSNEFSVTGDYEGKTITIPASAYEVASGSAFDIEENKLDSVVSGAALKWGDLYDVNTAKLTRRDAVKELKLKVNIPGKDAEPVGRKVTISDAQAEASDIRFYKDWSQYDAKDATFLAQDTEIKLVQDGIYEALYGPDNAKRGIGQYTSLQVHVFDQYGKIFKKDGDIADGVDIGKYIEYTVSDIKENTGDFAHLANSFKVSQNGSTYDKLTIKGAELGDTYTLTATIPETTVSKSVKITVGADTKAFVSKGKVSSDSDETFRKDKLNYKK